MDSDSTTSPSSWAPSLLNFLYRLLSSSDTSTQVLHTQIASEPLGENGLLSHTHSISRRMLRQTTIDNEMLKWILIGIGGFILLLAIVAGILAILWCVKTDQKADNLSKIDTGRQPVPMTAAAPGVYNERAPSYLTAGQQAEQAGSPIPPWEQGAIPPGMVQSSQAPVKFTPFVSNPRPAGVNAYERMVLISSLVHNPMEIAAAVLPNVSAVVYDWKNFTFQELARYMKKAIGTNKVTSIAVIAPASTPGCVGLLENQTTTVEKIKSKGEMAQFWRVVAGCVQTSAGGYDGRRVDLLGCRVVEAPREGAALLKELWALTSVPFAASDDALSGYQLATFLEEPNTGSMSLISSTIQAIDLYFDRYKLLGQTPPPLAGAATASLAPNNVVPTPLPPGPPPLSAINPNMAGAAAVAAVASAETLKAGPPPPPPPPPQPPPPQPPPPPAAGGDIFQRFKIDASAQDIPLLDLFKKFALVDPSFLQPNEVDRMVVSVVPDATKTDMDHFREMMDTNGDKKISREEFVSLLDKSLATSAQVDRPKSENNQLMSDLLIYVEQNKISLADYFVKPPKMDGRLDHTQIAEMVKLDIADLNAEESKYILAYFYKFTSKSSDGKMTFEEMRKAVFDHNK